LNSLGAVSEETSKVVNFNESKADIAMYLSTTTTTTNTTTTAARSSVTHLTTTTVTPLVNRVTTEGVLNVSSVPLGNNLYEAKERLDTNSYRKLNENNGAAGSRLSSVTADINVHLLPELSTTQSTLNTRLDIVNKDISGDDEVLIGLKERQANDLHGDKRGQKQTNDLHGDEKRISDLHIDEKHTSDVHGDEGEKQAGDAYRDVVRSTSSPVNSYTTTPRGVQPREGDELYLIPAPWFSDVSGEINIYRLY